MCYLIELYKLHQKNVLIPKHKYLCVKENKKMFLLAAEGLFD
jgi:hypothetical protein